MSGIGTAQTMNLRRKRLLSAGRREGFEMKMMTFCESLALYLWQCEP
jgi:hypothetical protein